MLTTALLLAPLLPVQTQVLVVDAQAGPQTDFTTLQPAIDAASEGAIVLVRGGIYGELSIDGKSLRVLADRASGGSYVQVTPLRVANLAPGQAVVVAGLAATGVIGDAGGWGPPLDQVPAFRALDCDAPVSVQRCSFVGPSAYTDPAGPGWAAQPGVRVERSAWVQVVDSTVYGGSGGYVSHGCAADASTAIWVVDSYVGLAGVFAAGGDGDWDDDLELCAAFGCFTSVAGSGARLDPTSKAVVQGSTLVGGLSADCTQFSGDGFVTAGGGVAWVDSTAVHGNGGDGLAGAVQALAGPRVTALSTPVQFEGDAVGLGIAGGAGDLAALYVSTHPITGFNLPGIATPVLIGNPAPLFSAVLPPSGRAVVSVTVPQLPPGVEGLAFSLQAAAVRVDPVGGGSFAVLGEARTLAIVDDALASTGFADCDGDGTPDLFAIESGVAQDCDGNGVPDACDIASGALTDGDGDGVADECDCNQNGLIDSQEIQSGFTPDSDGDGLPDGC